MRITIRSYQEKEEFHPVYQVQTDLLRWFHTLSDWDQILTDEWNKIKGKRPTTLVDAPKFPGDNSIHIFDCWTILFLNISFTKEGSTIVSYTTNTEVYRSSEHQMVTIGNPEYRQLQKILFQKNGIIPDEIWPRPEDDASWEHYSPAYKAQMDKDMKHFLTHINNGPWMSPEEN
ncbi:hypothetical protein PanWU01x14_185280 [Parasponia andersonii]|uniref:Uncharacterized protein n=1 Tax=Parasponia andersonii TaxID=3476 RepID=A0A2P5C426_PARAD|nr:hypothetical protein PanWU01x14_185280 [Parasponia andersonii]